MSSGCGRHCSRSVLERFAILSPQADQLQSTAEEFGCAAFVGHDVRLLVAQHTAPGRGHMGERKRIGRGAGRRQKHRHLALEYFPDPALHVPRQLVIAVAEREALIRTRKRRQNAGCNACGVVAREVQGKRRLRTEWSDPAGEAGPRAAISEPAGLGSIKLKGGQWNSAPARPGQKWSIRLVRIRLFGWPATERISLEEIEGRARPPLVGQGKIWQVHDRTVLLSQF